MADIQARSSAAKEVFTPRGSLKLPMQIPPVMWKNPPAAGGPGFPFEAPSILALTHGIFGSSHLISEILGARYSREEQSKALNTISASMEEVRCNKWRAEINHIAFK